MQSQLHDICSGQATNNHCGNSVVPVVTVSPLVLTRQLVDKDQAA